MKPLPVDRLDVAGASGARGSSTSPSRSLSLQRSGSRSRSVSPGDLRRSTSTSGRSPARRDSRNAGPPSARRVASPRHMPATPGADDEDWGSVDV